MRQHVGKVLFFKLHVRKVFFGQTIGGENVNFFFFLNIITWYVWWDGALPTSNGIVKDGEEWGVCLYIYIYIYIWLPKLKTSHVKFKVDPKNLKCRMVT